MIQTETRDPMGSSDPNRAWGSHRGLGPQWGRRNTCGPKDRKGAWGSQGGLGTTWRSQWGPGTILGALDHNGAQGQQFKGARDHTGIWGQQWGRGRTMGPGYPYMAKEPQRGKGTTSRPGDFNRVWTTTEPEDHNWPEDHNGAWGPQWGLGTTMGPGDHNGGLGTTMGPGDHKAWGLHWVYFGDHGRAHILKFE